MTLFFLSEIAIKLGISSGKRYGKFGLKRSTQQHNTTKKALTRHSFLALALRWRWVRE